MFVVIDGQYCRAKCSKDRKKGKFNRNVSFLLCNFNIFLPFPARSRDMVGYFGVEIMMEEGIRDA